jgi:hypothetical protein
MDDEYDATSSSGNDAHRNIQSVPVQTRFMRACIKVERAPSFLEIGKYVKQRELIYLLYLEHLYFGNVKGFFFSIFFYVVLIVICL